MRQKKLNARKSNGDLRVDEDCEPLLFCHDLIPIVTCGITLSAFQVLSLNIWNEMFHCDFHFSKNLTEHNRM